jgi:hypothetical protein
MMFRATVIALVASMASAKSFIPSSDISANSKLGSSLLSKATVVTDARHLENGRDVSFISNYKLKYLGCNSLSAIGQEGGEDGSVLYTQNLVRFALCPESTSCSTCPNGGEYVVNMMEFVDSWTEAKLEEQEYACEMVRENCYCDNANDDDVCEAQCYTNEGMDYCINYDNDGDDNDEFEIQRYLECTGKFIAVMVVLPAVPFLCPPC